MTPSTAPAEEVEVHGRTVRISHPDKVYFPEFGLTKRDLVGYVIAVADGLLAATLDRPTTLERWPGGVVPGAKLSTRTDHRGDAFFQKRMPAGAPDYVQTVTITFPSGRSADEVRPTEPAVLAWAANLGTLTFHPWPVTAADVEHPDQLRIDLDPQPGTDFSDAARVAPELREVLDEHGLTGYPKTSGGRGLHVFVPIEPRWTFTECRRAAITLGRELERRMPGQVTTAWWKEERGQTVFVDYNQMARDRTIASAYSVRANPRATVSTPLEWSEVDQVQPADFDLTTVPERFARVGDLQAPLTAGAAGRGSLTSVLELADRHERDGLGDLPYPPEYPKMPGEPARVQPSRARRTT